MIKIFELENNSIIKKSIIDLSNLLKINCENDFFIMRNENDPKGKYYLDPYIAKNLGYDYNHGLFKFSDEINDLIEHIITFSKKISKKNNFLETSSLKYSVYSNTQNLHSYKSDSDGEFNCITILYSYNQCELFTEDGKNFNIKDKIIFLDYNFKYKLLSDEKILSVFLEIKI